MSGEQNWLIPTSADQYFSHQNRRMGQEERRPSIRKASDILGPGIAPFAVAIDDLDGDTAAFNGFWIVEPGALNSPDDTKWWIGQTIADQFNGGMQMLSTFQPADAVGGEHTLMMRTFSVAPDSPTRFYSTWQQIAPLPVEPPTPSVALPFIAPFTTSTLRVFRLDSVVHVIGHVARSSGFSASFTTCANIPYGYRPNAARITPSSSYSLNTGVFYQYQANIAPVGVTPSALTLRQDAANANGAYCEMTWLTDDPMP